MTAAPEANTSTGPVQPLAGKYLTFVLEGESYAIPVLKVREIIRLTAIRAVPGMPAHVRGVINLRGKVIPVLDLRLRFGMGAAASTEQTCIMVVQVTLPNRRTVPMGLVVDAVEEVSQIAATDIEPPPDFGAGIATDFLIGMAKSKGSVKAMLDIDRVVGSETAMRLAAAAAVVESLTS
jgi:purine-binding chemotaxis protein CheW